MLARVLVVLLLAGCTAQAKPAPLSVSLGVATAELPAGGLGAFTLDLSEDAAVELDLPPGLTGELSEPFPGRHLLLVRVSPQAAPGPRDLLVHAHARARHATAALRVTVLPAAPIIAARASGDAQAARASGDAEAARASGDAQAAPALSARPWP